MILPSAHHSPRAVNKKAREFVMGTIKLISKYIYINDYIEDTKASEIN